MSSREASQAPAASTTAANRAEPRPWPRTEGATATSTSQWLRFSGTSFHTADAQPTVISSWRAIHQRRCRNDGARRYSARACAAGGTGTSGKASRSRATIRSWTASRSASGAVVRSTVSRRQSEAVMAPVSVPRLARSNELGLGGTDQKFVSVAGALLRSAAVEAPVRVSRCGTQRSGPLAVTNAEAIHGKTLRRDPWWIETLPTFLLLGGFMIYATGRPFRTPTTSSTPTSRRSTRPASRPTASTSTCTSSAPGGRCRRRCSSCRSRWASAPPATTTARPTTAPSSGRRPPARSPTRPSATRGETRFPFILQNLHRYFFWRAVALPVLPVVGRGQGLRLPGRLRLGRRHAGAARERRPAHAYSLSCHSCRHLCGGHLDVVLRRRRSRIACGSCVTRLNARHVQIAWISLFGVAADRPLRAPAGQRAIFDDPRFLLDGGV